MKTPRQLERHFKGVANHRRIQILYLIASQPKITVDEIANELSCNFKTISEHTRRLVSAGLVNKRYRGNKVEHNLSPYGVRLYSMLKTFSNS
jgi:predicted transcriptional regulator